MSKKGISLIVLIITVVVLAIIAGVTIYSINKTDTIGESDTAINNYNDRVLSEQVEYTEVEYVRNYKKNISSTTKEQVKNSIKTNKLKSDALTVFYDKNTQTEHVLYLYSKTTADQRTNLETAGIKMLKGDVDYDGFLTKKDVKIIEEHDAWLKRLTEEQKLIGDIDGDGTTDNTDSFIIESIINGNEGYSYQGGNFVYE